MKFYIQKKIVYPLNVTFFHEKKFNIPEKKLGIPRKIVDSPQKKEYSWP